MSRVASDVLVAPITRDLLPEVVDIERRSFSDPWSLHAFREVLTAPRAYFVGARQGVAGPLVGYVVAWFVADEGEIANLAVAPEARGRGVGARLLDKALVEGRARGAAAIFLEVRDSNRAARQLYESRGFVEVGRRKGYYRRPVEDAIVLRHTVESAGAREGSGI